MSEAEKTPTRGEAHRAILAIVKRAKETPDLTENDVAQILGEAVPLVMAWRAQGKPVKPKKERGLSRAALLREFEGLMEGDNVPSEFKELKFKSAFGAFRVKENGIEPVQELVDTLKEALESGNPEDWVPVIETLNDWNGKPVASNTPLLKFAKGETQTVERTSKSKKSSKEKPLSDEDIKTKLAPACAKLTKQLDLSVDPDALAESVAKRKQGRAYIGSLIIKAEAASISKPDSMDDFSGALVDRLSKETLLTLLEDRGIELTSKFKSAKVDEVRPFAGKALLIQDKDKLDAIQEEIAKKWPAGVRGRKSNGDTLTDLKEKLTKLCEKHGVPTPKSSVQMKKDEVSVWVDEMQNNPLKDWVDRWNKVHSRKPRGKPSSEKTEKQEKKETRKSALLMLNKLVKEAQNTAEAVKISHDGKEVEFFKAVTSVDTAKKISNANLNSVDVSDVGEGDNRSQLLIGEDENGWVLLDVKHARIMFGEGELALYEKDDINSILAYADSIHDEHERKGKRRQKRQSRTSNKQSFVQQAAQ